MNERAQRMEHRLQVPMLVAALLVVPAIVIEKSDVGQPWDAIALVTQERQEPQEPERACRFGGSAAETAA